jgi:hypothetical protein
VLPAVLFLVFRLPCILALKVNTGSLTKNIGSDFGAYNKIGEGA